MERNDDNEGENFCRIDESIDNSFENNCYNSKAVKKQFKKLTKTRGQCKKKFAKPSVHHNLALQNSNIVDLDISKLKGYNRKKEEILRNYNGDVIYEKLVEFSEANVKNIIEDYKRARQELNKETIQTRITKFTSNELSHAIKLGDPRFEKVLRNPIKYGYKYFTYRWDWKEPTTIFHGIPLSDLPYIGFTYDFTSRIEQEVENAIKNYANDCLTRFFDQAIIIALRKETTKIIRKINRIDREAELDPILFDIAAICNWYISAEYWKVL